MELTAKLVGGVAIVSTLATAGVAFAARPEAQDPQAAMGVARQEALNFFSLDHRHIDDDVTAVLDLAAGDFAKEYREKKKEIVAAVRKNEMVSTATVPDSGVAVESWGTDAASMLVAVDVSTKRKGQEPADARYRMRVELTRQDDGWRVTQVEQVG